VECLEARLLLAVTSVLDTSTGSLLVRGTDGDDAISVTREGTQIVVRAADMVINSHPADQVQALTIRAGAGNDRVIVGEGLGIASITVDGEEGDDFLQGSAANEALRGGAGDDTILPGGGTDSIDGGAGFDTVLVRGTVGSDRIDLAQPGGTQLTYQVADPGGTVTSGSATLVLAAGRPTVENVRVEAGDGSDLVRVVQAHALNATPALSLRFTVSGGPGAGDRLVVVDDGPGNLVLDRRGTDPGSGSFQVGLLAPVFYEGVETTQVTPLDPVTGGTGTDGAGRVVVFRADPLEFNDGRLNASDIDQLRRLAVRPSIDPGSTPEPFQLPGDEDWYVFRPARRQVAAFDLVFTPLGPLGNGQPGLPGDGELSVEAYDADGNLLAAGARCPEAGTNQEVRRKLLIGVDPANPALATIFFRVRGATPEAVNLYDVIFDPASDRQGPQVTNLFLAAAPAFGLFGPKPRNGGPTPPVRGLTIQLRDLSGQLGAGGGCAAAYGGAGFPALDVAGAAQPGLFLLRGDHTGLVPLAEVRVSGDAVELIFATPLADDRYTLTVLDSLHDPFGNRLDGEGDALQPLEEPHFPSGDGLPGGNFVARFTVDSRPEVGAYAATRLLVDMNGNFFLDPTEADAANRDLAFQFGAQPQALFAGSFAPAGAASASGFDQLGAYGRFRGKFRWLLDYNGDGVFDYQAVSGLQRRGYPVAGDFLPGRPGEEIGLFDGKTWYLDTNGNNNLDRRDFRLTGSMRGYPIVGDFDGDHRPDLATFQNDTFFIDLAANGYRSRADYTIRFGRPGILERPVAGDLDLDGIDDLGLFVRGAGEWMFLLSGNGTLAGLNHAYSPAPLGNDLFGRFGPELEFPLLGNFDPPPARSAAVFPASAGSTAGLVQALLFGQEASRRRGGEVLADGR
jgi:hypothetical protein